MSIIGRRGKDKEDKEYVKEGGINAYLVGVAWYTDVMVRYVPWFRGHDSIRFWCNRGKNKSTMLGFFSFILKRQ